MKSGSHVDSIFKVLDGKRVRVSSSLLVSEGSMEGEVRLRYQEHFGLHLEAPVRYNATDLGCTLWNSVLKEFPIKKGSELSYDAREKLQKLITEHARTSYVRIGTIYGNTITSIIIRHDDKDEICGVTLLNKKGSVEIRVSNNQI